MPSQKFSMHTFGPSSTHIPSIIKIGHTVLKKCSGQKLGRRTAHGGRRTDIWITKSLPELSSGEIKRKKVKPNNKTKWILWKLVNFPKLTQSRYVFKCMDRVNWTEWVRGKIQNKTKQNKTKKTLVFRGIKGRHFVHVAEGKVAVVVIMVVCVGGCLGILMRFVRRSLGMGMGVLGRRWVCVWGVSGWVSEFWTSGIVYMPIHIIRMNTVCLTQFDHKVNRVSFGKRLQFKLALAHFSNYSIQWAQRIWAVALTTSIAPWNKIPPASQVILNKCLQ